jgi:hypothetical protein
VRGGPPELHAAAGRGGELVRRDAAWARAQPEAYVNERYHQPIDASWKLLEGAVNAMRLAAVTGLCVADAPEMPAWRPGDELQATRPRAHSSVAGSK